MNVSTRLTKINIYKYIIIRYNYIVIYIYISYILCPSFSPATFSLPVHKSHKQNPPTFSWHKLPVPQEAAEESKALEAKLDQMNLQGGRYKKQGINGVKERL